MIASIAGRIGASVTLIVLARERSRHQLHRVLALPFGPARDGADPAACGVDQWRRQQAGRAPADLHVLEYLGARIGIISETVDADLLEPGARLGGVAGVDVDRDHLEALAADL